MVASVLVAALVVGGLVGAAADHWLSSAPASSRLPVAAARPTPAPQVAAAGGPATAPQPVATATPTTDPTQLAIQQVIHKADDEQAQALASKDPTVMQDTSTPTFYQEQVQTNQGLLNNGVTAIKLLGISWGTISVSSTTATATCWETWSTAYSDGITEQSQDRNDYTLVQQHGAWLVQSDVQPSSATGPNSAPGTANPAPAGRTGNPGAGTGGSGIGSAAPGAGGGTGGTGTATGSGNPGGGRRGPGSTAGGSGGGSAAGGNPGTSTPSSGTTGAGTSTGTPSPGVRTRPAASQHVSQYWAGYADAGGSFTSVIGTWTIPQFVSNAQQAHADQWLVDLKNHTTGHSTQAAEQDTSSLSSAE